MSIFERILRQSALYSVALVAARISSVVLLPVFTRYLTPASYGVLDLLSSAQLFFEMLVTMRLSEGVLYFFAKAGNLRDKQLVISTAFWGGLTFGAVTLVLGILFADPVAHLIFGGPGYTKLVRIAFLGVICLPISEIGLSYLRAINSPVAYAVVSIGRLVITIVFCVVLLTVYHMGPEGVLWSTAIGAFAPTVFLAVMLAWRNGLRLSLGGFWMQIKYSAPLCLSGFAITFIHYGDRFFLERAVSLSQLGLYSLAYKIGMLVSFIMTPFSLYWSAQMFHIVRGAEGDRVFVRLFTYLTLILSAAGLMVSLFAPLALRVLSTPAFQSAAVLVPFVAFAYVLRGMGDQLRSIFNLYKRTGQTSITTGAGVLTCLACYSFWIPKWGVYGALAATIAGFLVMAVANYFLTRRIKHFYFEWRRLITLLLVNVAMIAIFLAMAPTSLWLRTGFGALLMLVWILVLYMVGFFSPDEIAWLRRRVRIPARAAAAEMRL